MGRCNRFVHRAVKLKETTKNLLLFTVWAIGWLIFALVVVVSAVLRAK